MADVHLHAFQGAPAPPDVVRGWRDFVELTEAARNDVIELALRMIHAAEGETWAGAMAGVARDHDSAPERIDGAVNGCGWLLERAAAINMSLESFRDDVVALCGDRPQAGQPLIQRYEGLRPRLRALVTQRTLTDHGKMLVALDWRVDSVTASNRGVNLAADVVYLTLRYIEADKPGRITLQLTQQALKDLRGFLDRFAAGPSGV